MYEPQLPTQRPLHPSPPYFKTIFIYLELLRIPSPHCSAVKGECFDVP